MWELVVAVVEVVTMVTNINPGAENPRTLPICQNPIILYLHESQK